LLCRGGLFALFVFSGGALGGFAGALYIALGAAAIIVTSPGRLAPYLGSFTVLTSIAIASSLVLTARPPLALTAILLGGGSYVFLGLKARAFIYRDRLQYLAALGVTALASFLAFGTGDLEGFAVRSVAAVVAYLVLWREFFASHENVGGAEGARVLEGGKPWLQSAVVTFVAGEVMWALKLLPVTAGNAATLLTLAVFLITDVLIRDRESRVTARSILGAVTFIVLATLAVFAGARWSL
jgi:hypothetical protein